MKVKINYEEVDFSLWSFVKMWLFSWVIFNLIILLGVVVLYVVS